MEAVILVGGLGTRMGLETPKPLLEKNGRPVLEYIIDILYENHIYDITLKVDDRKEFDNLGYKTIKNLKDYKPKGDYVVTVGDIIVNFDFLGMYKQHRLEDSRVTVLTKDLEIPYGVIENGVWAEKPKKEIALGVFVVRNRIRGNSIADLVEGGFDTYKTTNDFTHLTTQEDYRKWKS